MEKNLSVVVPIGENRKMHALPHLQAQMHLVNVIVERGRNPSLNRNNGVKKASTPLVAFIDAHSLSPRDWAKKVIAFFKAHPEVDIVGGPQITPPNASFFERVSGHALASWFGAATSSTRYVKKRILFHADERHVTSANLVCRKEVLAKVRFDENLWPGEDPKFIADAIAQGFTVAFAPDIFVFHKRRATSKDLAQQIFRYGVARPHKESILRTTRTPQFLVPSAFLLYLVLLAPLGIVSTYFLIPGVAYLFLTFLFGIYFSIYKKEPSAFFVLPFIYFTIHVTYGLGFLYGLLLRKGL